MPNKDQTGIAPLRRALIKARDAVQLRLERTGWGIRGKLIFIFVVIKVVPLFLLALLAWSQFASLGERLAEDTGRLGRTADRAVGEVGQLAVNDSTQAINVRMREEIERMTTDIARRVADFLYERDSDITYARALEPDEAAYRRFLQAHVGPLTRHSAWRWSPEQKRWLADGSPGEPGKTAKSTLAENEREFHSRPSDHAGRIERRPLYLEMTFIAPDGRETIKVTASDRVDKRLRDVSRRENTFIRAENYFAALQRLKPGEIYVSEVIGAYVGTPIIGVYSPEAAEKAGVPFAPGQAAYAGKENPVGRRFQGLIRWATPVHRNGRLLGYVTLALDHDHMLEMTNTVVPTSARYTDIPDADDGNYAFMWDHLGRSIAHPRHHSIAGYDPRTGEPEVPWLEDKVDEAWRRSGRSFRDYIAEVPPFQGQSRDKTLSPTLKKEGRVGLDCRYITAPQCTGWFDLTAHGGSGSFLINWSGLWKITSAAAIPYYTGQYGQTRRGFGIVTVGANVDDFYRPAQETKKRIDEVVARTDREIARQQSESQRNIVASLTDTAWRLSMSTALMIGLVVVIAVWMASYLTERVRELIGGISRFRGGETGFRFRSAKADEMGALAKSFDAMADTVDTTFEKLREEVAEHRATAEELQAMQSHLEALVARRTEELSVANRRLHEEVEERRSAEERARHLALHDPLTGLANRRYFQDRLQQALANARRHRKGHALLYFDLDRFKLVNDTLGHETGDALLRHVAAMLQRCVREIDVVARLGGDEFAVLLCEIEAPVDSVRVANLLLAEFAQPIELLGHRLQTGTSIGIAYFDDGEAGAEQLLRDADMAMYQAKQDGGNSYRFFAQSMHEKVRESEAPERD